MTNVQKLAEEVKRKALLLKIQEDVHHRFKVKCAKEGVGMGAKIISLIKEYLK
jgi:hypothetical protein